MSKYYVNKFLYTIDRWEKEVGGWLNAAEATTWLSFTDEEREALATHDYVWLFEYGAHFFLNLTLFIALYDEEYAQRSGPLAFQLEMADKLSHWTGKNYPSIAL